MIQAFLKSPIFLRVTLFAALFVIVSGWYGSWIISTPLLYPFLFFIYGNLGKVLLFSFITFLVISRGKLQKFKVPRYNKKNLAFLISGLVVAPFFFPIASQLLEYDRASDNVAQTILAHAFIWFVPALFALGIFGIQLLRRFFKTFKKELAICLLIATVSYFGIFYIWMLWPYLSSIVLFWIEFLFRLSSDNVMVFPPHTLFIEKFAVTIGEACSGLESFLLFTGLSALIAYVDRRRLNVKRFVAFYIFGMIGAFIVNILRVYAIIWSGLLISPEVAEKLFHTYLGLIFFLIYFAILLKTSYKWICNE